MSEKTQKRLSFIINIAYFIILITLFYLFLKYAFWPVLPILIAGGLAIVLQDPVNKLMAKTKMRKGFASTLMVLLSFGAFILVMSLVGGKLITEVFEFLKILILKLQDYNWIERNVYAFVNNLPEFIETSLLPSVDRIMEDLKVAMANDSSSGFFKFGLASFDLSSLITTSASGVVSILKRVPSVLVGIVICVVASCFMTAEYDIISKGLRTHLPGGDNNIVSATKRVMKTSIWKLLRAYMLICCITALELFILLNICKGIGIFDSKYILAISILSAMFDILPIVGMGTILGPWGLYCLITGDYAFAVALAVIYIIITFVRQTIEPKLIAGQMSLPASLTITAMYIGLQAAGVLGMFACTIALYCIKVLEDEGIISFFRDKTKEKVEEKPADLITDCN